jgi:hypothetical protein
MEWLSNNELTRMWKESAVVYFEVLSGRLSGKTGAVHVEAAYVLFSKVAHVKFQNRLKW